MGTKFITLGELSDRTGLPVAWLRREASAGRLPSVTIGRRRMFDLDAVVHAITANERKGGRNG